MFKRLITYIRENKVEVLMLICLLAIAGIAHGYNMYHFPYYENDEGTYMSQAWAVLTQGKLAPYTYWYDHAPAGWIFISIWVKLTGGFFTFGPSVNSGRVFMLVLHLVSSVFLFYISKKLTKGTLAGIIAVLVFSLSPLAIYFQRRVLLDNIMIFWILGSLYVLLRDSLKLRHIILSGVLFGIAVLTKENAVFFAPAFLYVLFTESHKNHRTFAIVKWLTVSGFVVFTYFLFAALKGELLPVGFLGDEPTRVSLISTLQAQFSRGSTLPFWSPQSDFYITMQEWLTKDPSIVIAGAIVTILNLILCIRVKALRLPVLLAVLFWFFLMRGKLVINFYLVPLIPLIALNIGIFIDTVLHTISFKQNFLYKTFAIIVISVLGISLVTHNVDHYIKDETKPQLEALNWVFANVPKDAAIAIDDFAEVDYRENGYTKAWWFWKVWYDTEIQSQYKNDWKNIQYLYLSHEMLRQIGFRVEKEDPLRNVLLNSSKIVQYGPETSDTYININDFKSTNGDWVAMYKLKTPEQMSFDNSWQFYKKNFLHSYGQTIDPASGNTTSEGQSYALLRSVWMNDRGTFDGVWQWTRDHFQYRQQDKLFSWLWKDSETGGSVLDSGSASDADLDIALALILAGRKWGNPNYINQARVIIEDIWKHEVVQVQSKYYLTSGTGSARNGSYLVNPSYWSPGTYRIFATIDTEHNWTKLADDTYGALNVISDQSSVGLPPNWLLLTPQGDFKGAEEYVQSSDINAYGYDAFRTFWRVALDAKWHNVKDAHDYLNRVKPFFINEWLNKKQFAAIYDISGNPVVGYESLSAVAAPLSVFAIEDKQKADELYNAKFKQSYNDEGYWNDPKNYYDQNWAWFATALYFNYLQTF